MRTLLSALLLLATAARAERPVIDLSGAKVQAFPIALPPAPGAHEAAGTVHTVLGQDFDRSGLFKLLDPASFLASPSEPLDHVDFGKWQTVGAQALVKLSCDGTAAEASCEFRLYDVQRGARMLNGSYRGAARQVAHRFADDVVRFFTQEPGVFQTRIAYVREHDGEEKQIVVADSDGANPQVLAGGALNLLPSWTPDGRTIAFTSFRGGEGAHVYTVDTISRRISPFLELGDFTTGATFAKDGRCVFSASVKDNTDVYLARRDGSGVRRLTDARGIDISATFSPDGRRVAFVSERSGTPQIYTMTSEGTDVRRLTFQGNYNQEPAWSPKGDLIAFSGRDEKRVFDIYVVNVETGKVARLTHNAGSNEKPSWAPNGRSLLFASTRAGRRQIFTMAADGSTQRQITSERFGATDPAWGPLPK